MQGLHLKSLLTLQKKNIVYIVQELTNLQKSPTTWHPSMTHSAAQNCVRNKRPPHASLWNEGEHTPTRPFLGKTSRSTKRGIFEQNSF